jgi:beta-ribofuranosylaminobenzene 5'-phosphate synthase
MTSPVVRINAPSRLHFGLLAWGDQAPRQFGSVGLMIEKPGLAIEASVATRDAADGPLADRALTVLGRVRRDVRELPALHLKIQRAPTEHVGLGTGTALSLAVARLALTVVGVPEPSTARLAALTGRGLRSGIGLHGFAVGGLLVDGGRSAASTLPPLLARLDFPRDWSILVVIPHISRGLAGDAEREAFARLPGLPTRTIDRLCRLVLLELLPATAEQDLPTFGAAISELQHEVGRGFSPTQGGLFAHPQLEALAATLRDFGLVGVGQSSWGPTLYGFLASDPEREAHTLKTLQLDLGGDSLAFWTRASAKGAQLNVESAEVRDPVK